MEYIMALSNKHPLEGIVPPMVTPLLGRDTLDVVGLERLIEHVIAGGVHGLFFLGTTGEAPNLSYRLRREVITRACKLVNGRRPVLIGITDTSLEEAAALGRFAADAGAQAVVTSAPYYFPLGQPELIDFVERLLPELALPVYLYNMPQMTKVGFAPETFQRLAQHERIIGLKDSSGDLNYFKQLVGVVRARFDWRLFIGPEHLMAESIRLGGHGGVNGGAMIEPALFVKAYEAAKRGDLTQLAPLQQRILKLGQIYSIGQHASSVIKGIKCSLSLMGLCSGVMADPLTQFNPPERARVRGVLEQLDMLEPTKPATKRESRTTARVSA
jgi:dihydrodipicolinate synthase/N-acetylneuraminate lyase